MRDDLEKTDWTNDFNDDVFRDDIDGDYSDDYLATLMDRSYAGQGAMRRSSLSSFWSSGSWFSPLAIRDTSRDTAYEMMRIRNAVESLLRVHGLPSDCTVDVANLSQETMGCCSFRDPVKFTGARILLDKSVLDCCDSYAQKVDVYCGIGLHEASHALNTRKLFQWKPKSDMHHTLVGLLEDERIENAARIESPGFDAYLHAAKRALFEKQEFGATVDKIDGEELGDLEKLLAIIFTFLRCPYLAKDTHRQFVLIDDSCPWDDLKDMFPSTPENEDDVIVKGTQLWKWYEEKKSLYEEETPKGGEGSGGSGEGGSGEGGSGEGGGLSEKEKRKRIDRQRKIDESNKDDQEKSDELSQKKKDRSTRSKDLSRISEDIKNDDDAIEELDRGLKQIKEDQDKIDQRREGRFSEGDLRRMMERADKVTHALDLDETKEMAKATEERISFTPDMDNPCESGEKIKTILSHPTHGDMSEEYYNHHLEVMRGEINRMRNVFRLRLGTRKFRETERKSGRVHRRRLARCKSTDRIFYRKGERTDKGLSICLLLDESGSMGGVTSPTSARAKDPNGFQKADRVARISVLIAEALKQVPGIELEVYSYGSQGNYNEINSIKYLYGKNNNNMKCIGNYTGSCQNYDHAAILTATDLFIKNTENENRLMLIVSDGAPNGHHYGGPLARAATKQAAQDAEKKGINVVHVAIEAYRSEEMFKNSLKFTDVPNLINDMRRLLTRIIKSNTQ